MVNPILCISFISSFFVFPDIFFFFFLLMLIEFESSSSSSSKDRLRCNTAFTKAQFVSLIPCLKIDARVDSTPVILQDCIDSFMSIEYNVTSEQAHEIKSVSTIS